jgi:hypothetical protein
MALARHQVWELLLLQTANNLATGAKNASTPELAQCKEDGHWKRDHPFQSSTGVKQYLEESPLN